MHKTHFDGQIRVIRRLNVHKMVQHAGKRNGTDSGTGTDGSGTGHVTSRFARLNDALSEYDLENRIRAGTGTGSRTGFRFLLFPASPETEIRIFW